MLRPFDKKLFFTEGTDTKYGAFAQPNIYGQKLIAQYYAAKYASNIEVHKLNDLIDMNVFVKNLYDNFKNKPETNLRIVVIRSGENHSQPITYLRENKMEAFLIADSTLDKSYAANQIGLELKIPVFLIKSPRQKDSHSCHVDALIWGREITQKKGDEYVVPNLLNFLVTHSHLKKNKNYLIVDKLPSRLLMTGQDSKFISQYQYESPETVVHRGLSLQTFLDKHKRNLTYQTLEDGVLKEKRSNAASFLSQKSIKLLRVAEIQFYAEQLHQILGNRWVDVKTEYYSLAKAHSKMKAVDLLKLAEDFMQTNHSKPQPRL